MHLRDGVDKRTVLDRVTAAADAGLGDSVACVGAPRKGGGNMAKVHIHCNDPDAFFGLLSELSETPILRKEKVDDMYAERDGGNVVRDYSKASFNVIHVPASREEEAEKAGVVFRFPLFLVPNSEEPIDVRKLTYYDVKNILNAQRHADTRVEYTTASPGPMQIKVELLGALKAGKPVMIILSGVGPAIYTNILSVADSLPPSDRARLAFVDIHWGYSVVDLVLNEALAMAADGKSIDEAASSLNEIIDRNVIHLTFATSEMIRATQKWRPNWFRMGPVKDSTSRWACRPASGNASP